MYFVYILQSKKNNRYYIGSTNNLNRRLEEHNSGKSKSTSSNRPYELRFSKEFKTLKEAINIERKLKKLKSKKIIDKIVKDQLLKLEL